ncbi:hypothetical protein FB45DRAFT_909642 [Roridomyces roridus]|uniref:Uncharacterized protein n=1 Tax=Roridomyces roridus TaxID=1738132 RepID=A0AAD7FNW3_9AGAR|nr:hypothetical protein FB45DRAFT_909642 [Roridomyces roridus]
MYRCDSSVVKMSRMIRHSSRTIRYGICSFVVSKISFVSYISVALNDIEPRRSRHSYPARHARGGQGRLWHIVTPVLVRAVQENLIPPTVSAAEVASSTAVETPIRRCGPSPRCAWHCRGDYPCTWRAVHALSSFYAHRTVYRCIAASFRGNRRRIASIVSR